MNKIDETTIAATETDWRSELDKKNAAIQRLERELQIEAALKQVRTRSMAMQRSEELVNTALLLFRKLKELGIQQWANSFQLWDDNMGLVNTWTCTKSLEVKKSKIPTVEDPIMINIVNAAQGTGLGLSLSYDIIKSQGGEIKLETKEGAGSEFIIQLPFN